MNNSLVNDAVSFCQLIYEGTSPNHKWRAVSIAKNINRIFSYQQIPEIPTGYGYFYDEVPKYLLEEGVIETMLPSRWVTGVSQNPPGIKTGDLVTATAIAKGYIDKNQIFKYYVKYDRDHRVAGYGPILPGQFTALINIEALLKFIVTATSNSQGQIPTFDPLTGELIFMGEKITIVGPVEIKSMNLLIQNINSIVSKANLYEVREKVNYQQAIENKNATRINDIIEKIFKALRTKVKSNPKLNDILIFVQSEGFGIFIDRNQLQKVTAPQ